MEQDLWKNDLRTTIRQGRSENFFLARSYSERQRKLSNISRICGWLWEQGALVSMTHFGKRNSGFFGLIWGRKENRKEESSRDQGESLLLIPSNIT
jgi:hypothetical protein